MTFKQRFEDAYKCFKSNPKQYSLKDIKDQSPVVYSAHDIMAQESGKRCDDFVLCDCSLSTTGVYVIEIKGANPNLSEVAEQLQKGADFIYRLRQSDQLNFLPVLVAKGILSSSRNKLGSMHICLDGEKLRIAHVKSNGPLQKIHQNSD